MREKQIIAIFCGIAINSHNLNRIAKDVPVPQSESKKVIQQDKLEQFLRENYGIKVVSLNKLGGYCDLNYHVITTQKDFFLKIYKNDPVSIVRSHITFLNYCYTARLPVAKIIKSTRGKQYCLIDKKPAVLQDFIQGTPLGETQISTHLSEQIGCCMGMIHTAISSQKFPDTFDQHYRWNLTSFHIVEQHFTEIQDLLDREMLNIIKKTIGEYYIKSPQLQAMKSGVIHGDFHGNNILVANNNIIGILDVGDCNYSWYSADIAIALVHIFLEYNQEDLIIKFLQGYRQYFPLSQEEIQLLPILCKMRCCTVIIEILKDFGENIPQQMYTHIGKSRDVLRSIHHGEVAFFAELER